MNHSVSSGKISGELSIMVKQANKLLDFSHKLDIDILESVVNCMYCGTGLEQKLAQEILTTFKKNPAAGDQVEIILEFSKCQQTKYYGLQILETLIETKWKVLSPKRRDVLKKYIYELVMKTSSNAENLEKGKFYLNKLNLILVQILKREWLKNWPIKDLVDAATTNESLCQNVMIILKLLSEEVFEFSSGQMTQVKAKHLKDKMRSDFSQVFQLCNFVMENIKNDTLVHATLETLLHFLNWIPLNYIFETKLISSLISKFFNVPTFQNITLMCLTEIAGMHSEHYHEMFVSLFQETMAQLKKMLSSQTNIKVFYANSDENQKFIKNLSLFLSTFLKEHGELIEGQILRHVLLEALTFLLLISEVEDVEIFKICLEYWNTLAADLYIDNPSGTLNNRRHLYKPVLTKLRYIIIGRMAKPEDVLVFETKGKKIVREFMKDTDSIQLYKNMKETLVHLTHLDYVDTESIMTEKLRELVNKSKKFLEQANQTEKPCEQVNKTECIWTDLNTLCWAIGSISGVMHLEDEKRFIVFVLKELLAFHKQNLVVDHKSIIASNVMYIVGQYSRFLEAHWKLLKTVVDMLFKFMRGTNEGGKVVACDTFIKISVTCRKQFVEVQVGEKQIFIKYILDSIMTITKDLELPQIYIFYEAVGYMIGAMTEECARNALIKKYLYHPNDALGTITYKATTTSGNLLQSFIAVQQLGNILKINNSACKALGHLYVTQLQFIYGDILSVYKSMSKTIHEFIVKRPKTAMKHPNVIVVRSTRKEILKLISRWISVSNDPQMVLENLIPPLFNAVLLDYQSCSVPEACEPEVLSTIATIIIRLKGLITPEISNIFHTVLVPTFVMIRKDFQKYPEHQTYFFLLLQAAVTHCFPALVRLSTTQFKFIVYSITFSLKCRIRNVADTGLQLLYQVLQKISLEKVAAQSFYQTFYTKILQDLICLVTHTSLSAGLTKQATVLAYMFSLVESNKIVVSLDPAVPDASGTNNKRYVEQFVANLLKEDFGHLQAAQIKIIVEGFFNLDQDIPAFKEHLRDILIQIRENSGADGSDLYPEESEAELRDAKEKKRKIQSSVPGILNPHEVTEETEY